jgi:hypothetical protein
MQVGLPEGFRQLVAEMPKPVVAKREEQPRRAGGRPGGERQGQGRPGGSTASARPAHAKAS